jgi:hypothetical protein
MTRLLAAALIVSRLELSATADSLAAAAAAAAAGAAATGLPAACCSLPTYCLMRSRSFMTLCLAGSLPLHLNDSRRP